MALNANFTPCATRSDVVVTVGGTAVSANLPVAGNGSYLAYNPTANIAFLSFSGTATTSSPHFIAPGAIMTFGIPIGATAVSGIFGSSGTGTIYGVAGEGA